MPRRKKTPPQDMDVDSDEDNAISKQKKATEKFMALLKPIKDAALAFDVDVDEALEDYVEACVRYVEKDAGAMINFAEAGLLLQGSAVVYGRKVDGVHALVYRVLELLRTGQKEKEKAEKLGRTFLNFDAGRSMCYTSLTCDKQKRTNRVATHASLLI